MSENFENVYEFNPRPWAWHKDYSGVVLVNAPWLRLVEPEGPNDVVYVGDCFAHQIPMSAKSFYDQHHKHHEERRIFIELTKIFKLYTHLIQDEDGVEGTG